MPDEEKCNDSSDNFFISYVDYNILKYLQPLQRPTLCDLCGKTYQTPDDLVHH